MKICELVEFVSIAGIVLMQGCISNPVSKDPIRELVSQMTLAEKVAMVHGEEGADQNGLGYVGYLPGIERLGIPPLRMQNGPAGAGATFGQERHKAPATAFPVPMAQASTWNTGLLHRFGRAVASETRAQGRDVLLAPGVNIARVPEGGRNFEYFSEDPYLSGRCGVAVIKGIQEMGIMASAKHYVANSQETWRCTIDERISERALREIYLPAFEAAVKEGEVATLMASYNKINGVLSSENPMTLRQIAKEEWGFPGFIMTDWGTRHQAVSAANAGLDLEMSGWGKFGDPQFKPHLFDAVKNGEVKEKVLDEMVCRILREMKHVGLLGGGATFPEGQMDTPEHRKLALKMALEGAVLLRNDNSVLPLDADFIKKVALFGDALESRYTGGGSSKVIPFYSVTPIDGIKKRLPHAEVAHYESVETAADADVAIVFIFRTSLETKDRKTISLADESQLIEAVSKKYAKTVVMLRTAGAYTMPWIDRVDAVFQMWYPGQEEGNAEAALLCGDVSPSGKLPVTFGKKRADYPAAIKAEFPGIDERVEYAEGIFVGYRYFEHNKTAPLFAFGHGLSYTTFKYSDLRFSQESMDADDTLRVSYTITNTGRMAGAEVSQLYIQDVEASVERPVKELKGFSKVFLDPGESIGVEHSVTFRDLAFWDVVSKDWKAEAGEFKVLIGASSVDVRLDGSFMFCE